MTLSYCEFCKEYSIVIKKYESQQYGRHMDYRLCLNKGCESRTNQDFRYKAGKVRGDKAAGSYLQ